MTEVLDADFEAVGFLVAPLLTDEVLACFLGAAVVPLVPEELAEAADDDLLTLVEDLLPFVNSSALSQHSLICAKRLTLCVNNCFLIT